MRLPKITRLGNVLLLQRLLKSWLQHRQAGDEPAIRQQLERNRAKVEHRLAWARFALLCLPLFALGLDPELKADATVYGLLAYSLIVILITRARSAPIWYGLFACGDATILCIYAFTYLPGTTNTEAAFAYIVVADLVILINSLRLSQPLLWGGAALSLGIYYLRFGLTLDDAQLLVGGPGNLLLTTVVSAILLHNQRRLLVETRARARLRRFFSHEVADTLEQQAFCLEKAQAEEREITVLFVDIRGFTTLAEGLPPEKTVRFLNTFFAHVTEAAFAQGGMVDKYIGDCVMVVFGAPLPSTDHPVRAVAAARAIAAAVETWNARRSAVGEVPVRVGVGINTTTAVVGTLGSAQKIDYTAIGDGVNIASRVCALTKKHPYTVLLTEATRSRLGEAGAACADLGPSEISGRRGTVKLHGLCPHEAPRP